MLGFLLYCVCMYSSCQGHLMDSSNLLWMSQWMASCMLKEKSSRRLIKTFLPTSIRWFTSGFCHATWTCHAWVNSLCRCKMSALTLEQCTCFLNGLILPVKWRLIWTIIHVATNNASHYTDTVHLCGKSNLDFHKCKMRILMQNPLNHIIAWNFSRPKWEQIWLFNSCQAKTLLYVHIKPKWSKSWPLKDTIGNKTGKPYCWDQKCSKWSQTTVSSTEWKAEH